MCFIIDGLVMSVREQIMKEIYLIDNLQDLIHPSQQICLMHWYWHQENQDQMGFVVMIGHWDHFMQEYVLET